MTYHDMDANLNGSGIRKITTYRRKIEGYDLLLLITCAAYAVYVWGLEPFLHTYVGWGF